MENLLGLAKLGGTGAAFQQPPTWKSAEVFLIEYSAIS